MAQCSSALQMRTCWSNCRAPRCLAPLKLNRAASPHIRLQPQSHGCTIWRSQQQIVAATRDDVQPVPDLMIPDSDLECDRKWISNMIATWLDEEWLPQEVHKDLGKAAGDAYVKCRQQGDNDMSSLVLGISNELLSFNYRETFVNAFEVGNKVVEMLMMRSGVDVCCTTEEDAARIERVAASQSNSSVEQHE